MSDGSIRIKCSEKLLPLLTTPKRLKIAVGGRGGGKSILFADAFVKFCYDGERCMGAREFQNSIEDSVHALIKSRVEALSVPGMNVTDKTVTSARGGQIVYRGLARNANAIRSMFGFTKVWIEEGQTISQATLDLLLPTIRESGSEIWISMNRGSSRDPMGQMLAPYETRLKRDGIVETDDMLIVEVNYWDNPFFPEVLERQRLLDKERLPRSKYLHIWHGYYDDDVEGSIIDPEWFDACVDAHLKLGFKPTGSRCVVFDPSDMGSDPSALADVHGSVVLAVQTKHEGDVNESLDWALGYANNRVIDAFIWDSDGMGAPLRRPIADQFDGTHVAVYPFHGGQAVEDPTGSYQPIQTQANVLTNKDAFYNRRAQHYAYLRDRIYTTYLAVHHNEYHDPDGMISFCSKGCNIESLRAEVCRIPQKPNSNGKFQILTKKEMQAKGIASPNQADVLMMAQALRFVRPRRSERRPRLRPPPNWRTG